MDRLMTVLLAPEPDANEARELFGSLAPNHRQLVVTDHVLMPKLVLALSPPEAADEDEGEGEERSWAGTARDALVAYGEATSPAFLLASTALRAGSYLLGEDEDSSAPAEASPAEASPAEASPAEADPPVHADAALAEAPAVASTAVEQASLAADPERDAREEALRAQTLASGAGNNLTAAKDLVPTITAPHRDDIKGDARVAAADDRQTGNRSLMKKGEFSLIQAINCGEFTAASLYAAGYNLEATAYRDPASGRPVAYSESDGRVRPVNALMVVNMQPEATAAILAVQHADKRVREVTDLTDVKFAGSLRLTESFQMFDFATREELQAIQAVDGDVFGASAAAVAFGGATVELADRKPGDVQQRQAVDADGTYNPDIGHSATVSTVVGHGTVRFGVAGAPTLASGEAPSTPGWYAVTEDIVVLDSATAVENVADFAVLSATYVEANTAAAGGGGATPGQAVRETTRPTDVATENQYLQSSGRRKGASLASNGAFSVGRMPGSPWATWSPSTPSEPVRAWAAPATEDRAEEGDL